ncbi:MAG: hypothetical protein LPK45_07990 [Bacteroidota bacterium]|nr:hypothetical protein [Bacteroidota bacterium]MDX5431011.1 hypothetical protein [Bacteroidota bacterium]MDX5469762.1 hypothetical protein [Bacteroidota bacterium]
MKKPGTDKNAGKKKPASTKTPRVDDKRIEKYKKQSLNPDDEDEDLEDLEVDDVSFDSFDDFDDDFDDDDDF